MKYRVVWDLVETDPDTHETTTYLSVRDENNNKIESTTYTLDYVGGPLPKNEIIEALYSIGFDIESWENAEGEPEITVTPGKDE